MKTLFIAAAAALLAAPSYAQSSNAAFMFSVGGGVEVPIVPHFVANAGYRVSRISADTPVNTQSVTFGVGYKF